MSGKKQSSFGAIFRTLRCRNFRLFFIGQSISMIGTWMQSIAMGWLIYRLTGSKFLLGLVLFSSQIPMFLLAPIAGVIVDRMDKRRLLILAQSLLMLQSLVLAFLTLKGSIQIWQILALGLFMGCAASLDMPTRQSFIVDMIDRKEDLGNAIALNSLVFNAARLIGPALAGPVIAAVGEGVCFLINGITFIPALALIGAMKCKKPGKPGAVPGFSDGLIEGVRYAFGLPPIRSILILVSVISLTGASYIVLMPVYAKDILLGGPTTFGLLMAASGIGAIASTLYLAGRRDASGVGPLIPASTIVFSAGLIAFSVSRTLWISLALMFFMGFGLMACLASCNTLLQTITDHDKRGRVMSLYTMSFIGMAAVGSLMAGYAASRIGAQATLFACGACCMLASLVFAARQRKIYR